jgi:hypothetical protein
LASSQHLIRRISGSKQIFFFFAQGGLQLRAPDSKSTNFSLNSIAKLVLQLLPLAPGRA